MTFSIVARGADGKSWGIGVASKFLAVGAVVPVAAADAGALATQAMPDLSHRPKGLELLRQGHRAQQALEALLADDDDRAHRQTGIVDRDGGSASYTGAECISWAGDRQGAGYAVQGNCLAGADVVAAMEMTWQQSEEEPLSRRLLAALRAGDTAGGDKRGRQSAALLVVTPAGGYGGTSDVQVDLRVDDHPEPVTELVRLLDLHELYFGRPDPDTLQPLDGDLATDVRDLLAQTGHTGDDLDDTLLSWMGVENYEERHVPGSIDPLVLDKLRESAGTATGQAAGREADPPGTGR
ncbi:MAG: DUF1028 domain-containing protein [Acidothermales bacterium]|nr:DUF1028 domain-containing protein [Acidothermales bacterium]